MYTRSVKLEQRKYSNNSIFRNRTCPVRLTKGGKGRNREMDLCRRLVHFNTRVC